MNASRKEGLSALGLLILRIGGGGMMMTHGWGKLNMLMSGADRFPDPLGVGPQLSLILAVFAEFFCSILLILGAGTRLVAMPLLFTMFMAAFIIHGDDPFQKQELALLYGTIYLALILNGAGRFSLDHAVGSKVKLWRNFV